MFNDLIVSKQINNLFNDYVNKNKKIKSIS